MIVVTTTNAAFADLSASPGSSAPKVTEGVDGTLSLKPVSVPGSLSNHRLTAAPDLWPISPVSELAQPTPFEAIRAAQARNDREPVVREIREAPGSLSLFLSALLSVGGWNLVRSTRHANLAAVPEWYHSGGPIQIGHITPLNLSFDAMPLRAFEVPAVRPPRPYATRLDKETRLESQTYWLLAAPRGPPQLA